MYILKIQPNKIQLHMWNQDLIQRKNPIVEGWICKQLHSQGAKNQTQNPNCEDECISSCTRDGPETKSKKPIFSYAQNQNQKT